MVDPNTHLFPMMQALLVILELRQTLFCAGNVLGGRVDDVAGQHFLPEGEAAGLAYSREMAWSVWLIVACCWGERERERLGVRVFL